LTSRPLSPSLRGLLSLVTSATKLYNDQRVSARALTRYPGDWHHSRNCTPASEDGLKERSKYIRQK
jgi:hypothetical protein